MKQASYHSIYLTPREKTVLYHVLHGRSVKEIAGELHLSFHTVKNYLDELKYKYNCRSVKQLMAKFINASVLSALL